jgi:hypothetical protein
MLQRDHWTILADLGLREFYRSTRQADRAKEHFKAMDERDLPASSWINDLRIR